MEAVVTGRILAPVLGMMTLLMLTSAPVEAQGTDPRSLRQRVAMDRRGRVIDVDSRRLHGLPGRHLPSQRRPAGHRRRVAQLTIGYRRGSDVGAGHIGSRRSIRTTYVMGVYQGRPWRSSGFFLRVSSGMAFVRNWVVTEEAGQSVFTSKAFALELGAGWEWRVARRSRVPGVRRAARRHARRSHHLHDNRGERGRQFLVGGRGHRDPLDKRQPPNPNSQFRIPNRLGLWELDIGAWESTGFLSLASCVSVE